VTPEDLLARLLAGEAAIEATPEYRNLLRDLARDATTFIAAYRTTQKTLIEQATQLLAQGTSANPTALALLVFMAKALDLSSDLSTHGVRPEQEKLDQLQTYLEVVGVRDCLRAIYVVGTGSQHDLDYITQRVDWTRTTVHRVGTTSVLLRTTTTPAAPGDPSQAIVLKLVHLLFQDLAPLADAAAEYAHRTRQIAHHGSDALVQSFASTSSVIVTQYVPGFTLTEVMSAVNKSKSQKKKSLWRRELGDKPAWTRVEHLQLIKRIYLPILEAVERFHVASGGTPHADLSPSNILIETAGTTTEKEVCFGTDPIVIRLIDHGRNLLASSVIGRVSAAEGAFVAPEVTQLAPDAADTPAEADLFSLGLLMAYSCGICDDDDLAQGEVPREFFKVDLNLGRMAADLADRDPKIRARSLRVATREFERLQGHQGEPDVATLIHCARRKIEILLDIALEVIAKYKRDMRAVGPQVVIPSIRPVQSAFAITRRIKGDGLSDDNVLRGICRGVIVNYACFGVSSFVFLLAMTRSLEDVSWVVDNVPQYTLLKHIPWSSGSGSYPDRIAPILVGYSYAFAGLNYYVSCFWSVSFVECPGKSWLRSVHEGWLRYSCIPILVTILLTMRGWAPLWLLWSFVGLLFIGATNVVTLLRQFDILDRMKTYNDDLERPFKRIRRLEHSELLWLWTPSIFMYAALYLVLFVSAEIEWAQDLTFLGICAATVNIVFFAFAQGVRQGPRIEQNLLATAILGERTEIASQQPVGP
jgi:serine/threonine protein kinase